MNNPLLSIVVPIYNVEKFLPHCIDSLIAQTYHNIEIVLVDDGSPDKCGEICDQYAAKDSRIKVIYTKNAGVNEARITGFKESKGEYITFVDSDDYVSPLYVERLYWPIKEKGVALSCVQWINVKGNIQRKDNRLRHGYFDRRGIEDILRTDFLFNYKKKKTAYNLGLCCKMIKREYLVGAMENARRLWLGEDLIANLYLAYRIPSMYILDEYLYYYVQHGSQSTRNGSLKAWNNQVEQWKRILELDEEKYLSNQLPYRILAFMKVFVRNNIEQRTPIAVFDDNMKCAIENDISKVYFLNYEFQSLRRGDKLFFYIVKSGNYKALYFLFKVALPVRKFYKSLHELLM